MNGSPGFRIGTLVWFFITCGKMRRIMHYPIRRFDMCVNGGRS